MMTENAPHPILSDVDEFLSLTGMGAKYLGKAAVGNSELIPRLRKGGRLWPETEAKLRAFMVERAEAHMQKAS